MIMAEKTVVLKDGYIIRKRNITPFKNHYYNITKNGKSCGWYTYKELFEAIAILRNFDKIKKE